MSIQRKMVEININRLLKVLIQISLVLHHKSKLLISSFYEERVVCNIVPKLKMEYLISKILDNRKIFFGYQLIQYQSYENIAAE